MKLGVLLKELCLCIRLQLLWAPLKAKYLHIAAVGGLFESKVAYLCITVAVGLLWQQGTLHVTVALGGPFERLVSLLTHYIYYCSPFDSRVLTQCSCCWASLYSRVPAHYSCYWGPPWKQSSLLRVRSQNFSEEGAEVMEAKSLEKENLLVIRIAKESTYFVDKELTVFTMKTGGPSN